MKKRNILRHSLAALACCSLAVAGARADYDAIAADFSSYNFTLPVTPQGGFTVYEGQLYSWNSQGFGNAAGYYSIVDLESNNIVYQSTTANLGGNGYGDPFGIYDPVTDTFYAGTYGGSGTGMWRYNGGGTWTKLGVFDSLYGADSHAGLIYASGLNEIWNGSSGQDNVIALYDLSGGSRHDVLIQATGNSASVAVDKYGNVYYANYGNLDGNLNGLYVWSAAQIDSVRADLGHGGAGGGEDDLYLTYGDGVFLTQLPGGANGITVDDAGNVFVSVNGDFSGIVMWNMLLGVGSEWDLDHYIEIAGIGGFWGWAGFLDAEGNVLDGGTLYAGSSMLSNDFSLITYSGDPITPPSIDTLFVPEPSTVALLLVGMAGLMLRRKARRLP